MIYINANLKIAIFVNIYTTKSDISFIKNN